MFDKIYSINSRRFGYILNLRNYKDGARGRSRTGTRLRARDFKSLVSTNFTTRAKGDITCDTLSLARCYSNTFCKNTALFIGGANQSRTGLNGFAGRGITALLSRHNVCNHYECMANTATLN
jgi:hypothetical protein